MWNPFAIRSNEARRLELRIVELEDDLSKAVRLIERIDARGRGRIGRESASTGTRTPDGGVVSGPGDVRQPAIPVGDSETPAYTKEQLRQFARNRGLSA